MSLEPGLFVPTRADALIRGQRKVEAIKAVLDANPGASLRAAKDAVEARTDALLAGSAASLSSPAGEARETAGLPAAALEALQRGQIIEAIKLVRLAHDVDLRTAKQRVEAHLRGDVGADVGTVASQPDAAAASAPGELPADVASLLRGGDRGAAWQLLERKYGATATEALRRIGDHEIARKRGGRGGAAAAGSTVMRGGDRGKLALWALLAAFAALAVAWVLW
ncbi:hypothetical protein GLE_0988 [Lysobacter enzymogenes]|uniref:Ribosomal protein L7/L12 C-terminal domain-containing protein n=1 Tax=Lysobacter enzymogenes TaxID=69 RepID=A0A0S2DCW6_LYSEN|nr:hypothetical protein [Lysobacter enzymogenes]ALN56346.1 hypothetical protein GLE_0988 [Lysobacter enzymogenes]